MAAHRLAFGIVILMLASCGQEEQAESEMSQDDVAAILSTVELKPGRWENWTEITSATGLPASARSKMIGRKTASSDCISAEQAQRPNPAFLAAQAKSECTYHSFAIENGRLSAQMTCRGGAVPGDMLTRIDGSYGSESFDLDVAMRTTPVPGGEVEIRSRSVGRRTGAC